MQVSKANITIRKLDEKCIYLALWKLGFSIHFYSENSGILYLSFKTI